MSSLQTRIQECVQLRDRIQAAETADNAVFTKLFVEGVEFLELDDRDVAIKLKVSRPTVNRWMHGTNLPHPGMRGPVLAWVAKELQDRKRTLASRLEEKSVVQVRPSRAPASMQAGMMAKTR